MPERQRSYQAQLAAVLRKRVPLALRRFLVGNARTFGDSQDESELFSRTPDELRELMHRMILARPDLADLHRQSREWLFNKGIDPFGPDGSRRN